MLSWRGWWSSSHVQVGSQGAGAFTTGFGINSSLADASIHGALTLFLKDSTSNTWVCNGTLGRSNNAYTIMTGGSKSLSATLDRIRLTTVGGADTFDAGSINILYE